MVAMAALVSADELADVLVDQRWLVVHHPVACPRDAPHLQVGNVLLQTVQVASQQGSVALCPNHQSGDVDGDRRCLLWAEGSVAEGAIVVEAASQCAGCDQAIW